MEIISQHSELLLWGSGVLILALGFWGAPLWLWTLKLAVAAVAA